MPITDAERTRLVLDAFDALLDAQPGERRARLQSLPDDIAAEVRAMLEVDEEGLPLASFDVSLALVQSVDPLPSAPFEPAGFVVHERIGRGAMGEVFRATQEVPRREVALKRVDGDGAREAQALAEARHPVIPAVYGVGSAGDACFVAMELVRGRPLLEWAAQASPLERLELLATLCRGVHAVHEAGVLHRDLKPANVMVDASGPRLVDFGLAVDVGASVPGLAGTLPYLADEVLQGAPATVGSDVFSLGCIVAEVLGGRAVLPWARTPERQRRERTAWELPLPSAPWASVVRHALGPPVERYASAAELAAELARLARDEVPLVHQPRFAERWARFRRRRGRAVLGVGLVAALVLAVGGGPVAREALREHRADGRLHDVLAGGPATPEVLTGFLGLPEVQGTDAADRARLLRAEALRVAGDLDGERRDLAAVFANGRNGMGIAAERLAEGFVGDGRWSSLDAVWPSVPTAGEQARLQRLAAIGNRDWSRPEVDFPAVVEHLRQGTRTDFTARRVWGDGQQLLSFAPGQGVRIGTATSTERVLPWPEAWGTRVPHMVDHDGPLFIVDKEEGRLALVRPAEEGWETVATPQIDGKVSAAAIGDLDEDGVPTLFVGTAAHPRSLWAMEPPLWEPHLIDPDIEATDADLGGLQIADLDGDGRDELVVQLGPWTAYDLRVYRQEAGGLELLARERLGGSSNTLVFALPDGRRRIAVLKDDKYPNPLLYGADTPMGDPEGVYIYAFEGGALVRTAFAPLSDLDLAWTGSVAGDFDGDGDVDLVSATKRGMLLVELDAEGHPEAMHRVDGLRGLHVGEFDGTPGDELFAALGDDSEVWVLGSGDDVLPAVPPPQRAGSRLEQMGLYRAAAEHHTTLAKIERDPEVVVHHLSEAARLHAQDHAFDESVRLLQEARALRPGEALDAQLVALLERTARHPALRGLPPSLRSGPLVEEVVFDLKEEVPAVEWVRPAAFDHRKGEGLRLLASSGDGVLLRLPVRRTGPVVGVTLEAEIRSAEAGANLHVGLRAGDERLALRFRPWGGAEQVSRKSRCLETGPSRNLALFDHLQPEVDRRTRHRGRVLLDGEDLVCEWSGEAGRLFVRRPSPTRLPEDLVLEVWMSGRNAAPQVEAVLERLTLVGLDVGPVGDEGVEVVTGQLASALPTLMDPLDRLEVLGRLARQEAAREVWRTNDFSRRRLVAAVRRQPTFWLDLLREEAPERVAGIVAEGWSIAYGSGRGAATASSLERGWIDGLVVEGPTEAFFLLRHAERLALRGMHDRALAVFRRVEADGPPAYRGPAALGAAGVLATVGRSSEALEACRAAAASFTAPFAFEDRVAARPVLVEACAGGAER